MERKFDGVIFDMDGTIIEQMLDFDLIRATLGVPPELGILEYLKQIPPQQAQSAEAYLLEQERLASEVAVLHPGAAETIDRIRSAGMKVALLTRNSRTSMETVLKKYPLPFDLTWSRENGPIKPEPDGILRACKTLGIDPERTCCVGDFDHDIFAANAAGAVSILLDGNHRCRAAGQADYVITHLEELAGILEI